MNFYKWSLQKECFVGFDQAYVKTQLNDDEFFNLLRMSAETDEYKLDDVLFGYFLQYKVVQPIRKRGIYTPPAISNSPHYRVELTTRKNKQTGASQHELLFNLSKNIVALVYYACPMLFDKTDLYEINADLDQLRLVELESCNDIYDDNDNHYIYFDGTTSEPIWKSEPHTGHSISPKDFVLRVVERYGQIEPEESRRLLYDLLTDLGSLGISEKATIFEKDQPRDTVRLTDESLMIVQIRRG